MKRKQTQRNRQPAAREAGAGIHNLVLGLSKRKSGSELREIVGGLANIGRRSAGRRKLVLAELANLIKRKQRVLYGPTPEGLKGQQKRKYTAMIRSATTIQAATEAALGILGPAEFLDEGEWPALLDRSGMLDRLGRWREHLLTMWPRAVDAARQFKQAHRPATVDAVKFYGVGGSAAPHDITREVIENFRRCGIAIEVVRADAPNPDHVTGKTLAIFASFSGNTEETLHCLDVVRKRTGLLVGIARGGDLRGRARELKMPFIQLPDDPADPAYVLQPRESVCLQAIASLVFLSKIGLKSGSGGRFTAANLRRDRVCELLDEWRGRFGPAVPFRRNPAKRLAYFSLYGAEWAGAGPRRSPHLPARKIPYLIADRNLRAVLHEGATQFRERSKVNVVEGLAPEDLHNSVESIRAAVEAAKAGLSPDHFAYIFFDSEDSQPRIGLRLQVTRDLVFANGPAYAVVRAEGETPFERSLFLTYFNAHVTSYAALLNGFDPLPVPTMSWLKEVMKSLPRDPDRKWTRVSCSDSTLCICKRSCRSRASRWLATVPKVSKAVSATVKPRKKR